MSSESITSGTQLDFRFAFCDDAEEIAEMVRALWIYETVIFVELIN